MEKKQFSENDVWLRIKQAYFLGVSVGILLALLVLVCSSCSVRKAANTPYPQFDAQRLYSTPIWGNKLQIPEIDTCKNRLVFDTSRNVFIWVPKDSL